MIVDYHPIPRLEFLIQSPGGVCDNKLLNSGMRELSHIRGNLSRRIAFVQMNAALRENQARFRNFAKRELETLRNNAHIAQSEITFVELMVTDTSVDDVVNKLFDLRWRRLFQAT